MSRFPLASLLRLREAQEQAAAARLASANAEARARRTRSEVVETQLLARRDLLATAPDGAALLHRSHELSGWVQDRTAAEAQAEEAQAVAAGATGDWLAANGRLDAMDTVRERWVEAERKEQQRLADREVDDLVSGRSARAQALARSERAVAS